MLGILTGRGNHEAENFDRVGSGRQLLAAFAAGLFIRLAEVPSDVCGLGDVARGLRVLCGSDTR